ncbi:MAG: hypothetical protein MR883_08345 [Clostridiales bacterium]|nr:hypothetical protein [Clostridiales bacterium]
MKKRKSTRVLMIILSVIMALSLLAAAGFGICYSLVEKRLEGCRILADFVKQEEMELRAEVSADLGGTSFTGSFPVFRRQTEEGSFFGVTWENQTLYLRENVFYLSNGRAFRISAQLPQGEALLEQAQLVLSASKVTREKSGALTVYRAEAGLDQAKAILKYLSPQTAEKMSIIDSLVVTLTAEDRTLRDLTVTAAGSDGTSPYTLRLTLTVLDPGTLDTAIPQAVQEAVKNPGDIITLRWDPDALPLLRGVLALASRNDFQAELGMKLECGIFSFSNSLEIQYNSGVQPGIGRLAGDMLEFYFSGSKLCTAGGKLLTEYDEVRFDRLLALALPVLVEGKVESLRSGDSGQYTMPLTREELDMIAAAVASQAAGLTINLTEGTLEARVTDNRLAGVSFTCNGSVPILSADIPAGVTVTLRPAENPQTLVIPDAVRAALGGEN